MGVLRMRPLRNSKHTGESQRHFVIAHSCGHWGVPPCLEEGQRDQAYRRCLEELQAKAHLAMPLHRVLGDWNDLGRVRKGVHTQLHGKNYRQWESDTTKSNLKTDS